MNGMFLVVTAGLGHVVSAEVPGDAQYLAGPDDARVTDLVAVSPVEKGPKGRVVVDIGLGSNLGKGFAPLYGVGSSKSMLTSFFRHFPLGLCPGLRLDCSDPCSLTFPLVASFLRLFTSLPLTVGGPLRRCLLLAFSLLAPYALGIHQIGQQLSLCQGQQIELLGSGQFVVGKQQLPLAKGILQVGKLLGEVGLATFPPGNLDGGPGLRPPAGKLGGTGGEHLNNEGQQQRLASRMSHRFPCPIWS